MSDTNIGEKKFQWSKFSPDHSEQFVLRTDDWKEFLFYRDEMILMLPKAKAFPDDEGPTATPPEKTQESVPFCAIHKTPMKLRQGQFGTFWSCGKKNTDDTWCSYRPPKGK